MERVSSYADFVAATAKEAMPWPGAHPDIRYIVLRRESETADRETDRVIGYLKKGSNLLVDFAGNAIGGTPKNGDFIDTYDSFQKLGYDLIIPKASAN